MVPSRYFKGGIVSVQLHADFPPLLLSESHCRGEDRGRDTTYGRLLRLCK